MHDVEVIVHVSIKLDKRERNLRDCSDGVGSGHPTVPSSFCFWVGFFYKKESFPYFAGSRCCLSKRQANATYTRARAQQQRRRTSA